LLVVGILKLPFDNFKAKHPKWYKAIFTLISIILSTALSVIDEIYILCGGLFTIDFAILICVVFCGVFCGYGGVYEGLGLKELVKKLVSNLKVAKDLSNDKRFKKKLNKIEDVDKAIAYLEEMKNNQNNEV
jgi:hypothetical protein